MVKEKRQELSGEQRLLDLIALLIGYSGFPWEPILFFSSERGKIRHGYSYTSKDDYASVVKAELSPFLEKNKSVNLTELILDLKELRGEITVEQLEEIFYGEKVFSSNGNIPFKFNRHVLSKAYADYLRLSAICPFVYVSFYFMKIKILKISGLTLLLKKLAEMESLFAKSVYLDNKNWSEIVTNLERDYEDNLVQKIKALDFQFQGHADEKGIFINESESLVNNLKYIAKDPFYRINYLPKPLDVQGSIAYLQLKAFQFRRDGVFVRYQQTAYSINEPVLHKEFQQLKAGLWEPIIGHLESLGFSQREVDTLLNTFHLGHFYKLGNPPIRFVSVKDDVQVFHLFYLFKILDFEVKVKKNPLEDPEDFQNLMNLQRFIDPSDVEKRRQLMRNFKAISNPNSTKYPFKKIHKTIELITRDLGIDAGKLKSPPTN